MNTANAVVSTLVIMGVGPVGDPRQKRGHRYPGELIPVKEREAEQDGIVEIVERNPQQPDERQQEKPEIMMSIHVVASTITPS
jgi:hypothetical protein